MYNLNFQCNIARMLWKPSAEAGENPHVHVSSVSLDTCDSLGHMYEIQKQQFCPPAN